MRSRSCAKLELLVGVAVFFAAFGSAADAEPNTASVEPNALAELTAKNSIAVTVNGVDITEGEVDVAVDAAVARELMDMKGKMPLQIIEQYKKGIRPDVLGKLIGRLLVDERMKAEVTVTEEEVIAHLERIGAARREPLSLEAIKRQIEASGRSFDQIKENIRRGLSYQRLMEPQWAGKVNITEDDAKKYYEENPTLFESPERVRAGHILIKPDSDPNRDPNEAKAEARAKVEELLRMIRDGNDFATLARKHSDCPSARRGGDLGFERRRGWVKPFADAAFKLKVGQVSDVVETQYGYHIIRVTARKEPTIMTFEEAKDGIINELARRRREEIAKAYVESLKDKASIVYPPGKEPKVSKPVPKPPKPTPVDSNAPAKPVHELPTPTPADSNTPAKSEDTNAVE
jgi:peptidyl-prolyl cis-trans isomerase C